MSAETAAVELDHVVETWRLATPVEATTAYANKRVRIFLVKRTLTRDDKAHLSFHGVPLTSKGNPNGTVDYRFLTDDEGARIGSMLPPPADYFGGSDIDTPAVTRPAPDPVVSGRTEQP